TLREQIPVISRPETYCFPRDWFYDTVYHLNKEGRQQRTEALLRDMEQAGLFRSSISAQSTLRWGVSVSPYPFFQYLPGDIGSVLLVN
ncbi:MAG: hypothetical protein LBB80_00485, partial [Treponema sp.]|nr:hypothetical protein [Treponema sp.]